MSTYLDAQIGFADETTFATRVVPTRFLPHVSESLQLAKETIQSKAYRSGRKGVILRRPSVQRVTGNVAYELAPQGLGLLLKHMFGSVATTGAGPYTHTFTPGAINGKSMSIQKGVTDAGGTTRPFDYAGCKVTSWAIDAKVGEIATITPTIYGVSEDTTQSLATASYPAGLLPFTFLEGHLTVGGTEIPLTEVSLKGDNGLKVDRHRITATLPAQSKEPQESSVRAHTGQLDADFVDLTAYALFIAKTQSTLVLTFTSGAFSLVITMSVEFDGQTPNSTGAGSEPQQTLPFTGVNATSDANIITAVLTNNDSTP